MEPKKKRIRAFSIPELLIAVFVIIIIVFIAFKVGNSYMRTLRTTDTISTIKATYLSKDIIGKKIDGKILQEIIVIGKKLSDSTGIFYLSGVTTPLSSNLNNGIIVFENGILNTGSGINSEKRIDLNNSDFYFTSGNNIGARNSDEIFDMEKYAIFASKLSSNYAGLNYLGTGTINGTQTSYIYLVGDSIIKKKDIILATCEVGFVWNGSTCISSTPTCTEGEHLDGNSCIANTCSSMKPTWLYKAGSAGDWNFSERGKQYEEYLADVELFLNDNVDGYTFESYLAHPEIWDLNTYTFLKPIQNNQNYQYGSHINTCEVYCRDGGIVYQGMDGAYYCNLETQISYPDCPPGEFYQRDGFDDGMGNRIDGNQCLMSMN